MDVPEVGDEIIAFRYPGDTAHQPPPAIGRWRRHRDSDSLRNDVAEELLILADFGIEFIVSLLDRLRLFEARPREKAGKQRNGGARGKNAGGVRACRNYGRRRPDSEAVRHGPVLDHLNEAFSLRTIDGGGIQAGL